MISKQIEDSGTSLETKFSHRIELVESLVSLIKEDVLIETSENKRLMTVIEGLRGDLEILHGELKMEQAKSIALNERIASLVKMLEKNESNVEKLIKSQHINKTPTGAQAEPAGHGYLFVMVFN